MTFEYLGNIQGFPPDQLVTSGLASDIQSALNAGPGTVGRYWKVAVRGTYTSNSQISIPSYSDLDLKGAYLKIADNAVASPASPPYGFFKAIGTHFSLRGGTFDLNATNQNASSGTFGAIYASGADHYDILPELVRNGGATSGTLHDAGILIDGGSRGTNWDSEGRIGGFFDNIQYPVDLSGSSSNTLDGISIIDPHINIAADAIYASYAKADVLGGIVNTAYDACAFIDSNCEINLLGTKLLNPIAGTLGNITTAQSSCLSTSPNGGCVIQAVGCKLLVSSSTTGTNFASGSTTNPNYIAFIGCDIASDSGANSNFWATDLANNTLDIIGCRMRNSNNGWNKNNATGGILNILGGSASGVTNFLVGAGSGITVKIRNVQGYNPQAVSGVLTAGASPYTVPAQPYPYIYLQQAANGISAATLDGVAIPITNNQPVLVNPGHVLIITWAVTAPTFKELPQ